MGPLLVAAGALLLLVSLFLDWFGDLTAWETFELTDVVLAALALAALVAAAGLLAPNLAYLDRRWLPAAAFAVAVVVIAQILSPPPQVGDADPQPGAWIGFGAALAMLAGSVLSVGRVSFSIAVESREPRQRVAAVDHRPPPTDTGSIVPRPAAREEPTPATEPAAATEAPVEPPSTRMGSGQG